MSLSQKKKKLLNYNELLRLTFEDLNKRIANKNYVIEITDFLNDTMKNINSLYRFNSKTTKVFLLSYVILFHTNIINDRKDDFAKKMTLYSSDVVYSFEEMYENNLSIKTYETFKENLDKYFIFFKKWKERDALILIRPMLQSCFTIDTYIEQLEKKENTETEILSLKDNLSKIVNNIKIIGGPKGLEFYKSKKLPIFIDEKIFTDTEKVVRRAFWDVFEENIKEKNHKQVPELLKDIKKLIQDMVNNKTFIDDFDNNININYIESIIDTEHFNMENIKKYFYYLISKLEKMQPPSEDKVTKIFLNNINKMINKKEKNEKILRYFFENYFQKLEKIKYLTLYIKKNIKIETI